MENWHMHPKWEGTLKKCPISDEGFKLCLQKLVYSSKFTLFFFFKLLGILERECFRRPEHSKPYYLFSSYYGSFKCIVIPLEL